MAGTELGLPTSRGVEHLSVTVADLDEVTRFFTHVFGCQTLYTMGPFQGSRTAFMREVANADVRTVVHRLRVLRSPFLNIELFEVTAPRQRRWWPDLLDIGGWGLTGVVDDLEAAIAYLEGEDVFVLDRGKDATHCMSPWGFHFSLTPPPDDGELWDPAHPDRGARPTFTPAAGALPTFRGFERLRVTVADLDQASAIVEDALGFEPRSERTPGIDTGAGVGARTNVDARAAPSRARIFRSPYLNLEVVECPPYPGQDRLWPAMFDIGGWHLTFYVDDIDAASSALTERDVLLLGGKKPAYLYEAGDEAYTLHGLAPFGLYFELVTYPHGRYQQADHAGRAWHPAHPGD